MTGLPSKRLADRVARAARLWAAGNSWEAIARILRCRPRTCQRWPTQYPVWWNHVTQQVKEEQWREMCTTCDRSLREMLRGTDAKYRRKAANLILEAAGRNPPMVSAEAVAEARLVLAREAAGAHAGDEGDGE